MQHSIHSHHLYIECMLDLIGDGGVYACLHFVEDLPRPSHIEYRLGKHRV